MSDTDPPMNTCKYTKVFRITRGPCTRETVEHVHDTAVMMSARGSCSIVGCLRSVTLFNLFLTLALLYIGMSTMAGLRAQNKRQGEMMMVSELSTSLLYIQSKMENASTMAVHMCLTVSVMMQFDCVMTLRHSFDPMKGFWCPGFRAACINVQGV